MGEFAHVVQFERTEAVVLDDYNEIINLMPPLHLTTMTATPACSLALLRAHFQVALLILAFSRCWPASSSRF